jgi:hypothetical protein
VPTWRHATSPGAGETILRKALPTSTIFAAIRRYELPRAEASERGKLAL